MGVHGLTTYIDRLHKTKNYRETVTIRDVPVVIDGSNLMYHLYFSGQSPVVGKPGQGCSIPNKVNLAHLFGGDWLLYAQNVRYFFQQLKHCEILPIVVFDGAYEDGKIKVAFKRFEQSIRDNINQSDGGMPGSSYTPLQLKTVFLEILEEQKIPHYQTSHEADQMIAFIAKLLGRCPILSEDSDFYIYADAVAVSLKSLRFRLKRQGKDKKAGKRNASVKTEDNAGKKVWTLEGDHVPMMKIMKKEFNIESQEILATAALIIGNDSIYSGNTLVSKGRGEPLSKCVEHVFRTLSNMKNIGNVFEQILKSATPEKRPLIATQLAENLAVYKGDVGDLALWNLIKEENEISQWIDESIERRLGVNDPLEEILEKFALVTNIHHEKDTFPHDPDVIANQLKPNKCKLPDWFMRKHYKCDFQTYLKNIQENQVIFFVPQVEIRSKSPCHHLSLPIVQVTCGILLGDEEKTVTLATHQSGKPVKVDVKPKTRLPGFGPLPYIQEYTEASGKGDFGTMPHETRLKLMLNTLRITEKSDLAFYEGWPPAYKIWIAALLFFMKQSQEEIENLDDQDRNIMRKTNYSIFTAIFLCIIKNLISNPGNTSSTDKNSVLCAISRINQLATEDPKYLASIRLFYQKFEDASECSHVDLRKQYDISCARVVCQFMCIIYHTGMLNSLLFNTFKSPKYRYVVNNFFIYNFAYHLKHQQLCAVEDQFLPHGDNVHVTGIRELDALLGSFFDVIRDIENHTNKMTTALPVEPQALN